MFKITAVYAFISSTVMSHHFCQIERGRSCITASFTRAYSFMCSVISAAIGGNIVFVVEDTLESRINAYIMEYIE